MSSTDRFPRAVSPEEDTTLSITELLTALGEEKRRFLAVSLIGAAASLAVALLVPRYYVASALLIPPQQPQSTMVGALAQLGALAGMSSGAGAVKSPDEMYLSLLKTRRVQDALIKKFGLQTRYGAETLMDTRTVMDTRVAVSSSKKTGMVTIEVMDRDSEFAARLANAHVDELRRLLSVLALTEAQQRRLFLEQHVERTRTALSSAEAAFRKAQAESGFVVSQALAESGVRSGIELRAQIAAKEVQLQSMSQFFTTQSIERQRLVSELVALRQQLGRIEQGSGASTSTGGSGGQAALQAFRNMKVHEGALEALVKQLELARLDESREGPLLQLVDAAEPPERATRPSRALIAVGGTVAVSALAAVWAIARALGRRDEVADGIAGWRRIKAAWF